MRSPAEVKTERVLIVGGSSGMGLALARMLIGEGTEVTIAGRSEARLASARASLGQPDALRTLSLDITQESEVSWITSSRRRRILKGPVSCCQTWR